MKSGGLSKLAYIGMSTAVVSLAIAGCSTGGGESTSSSTSAEAFETSTTTPLPPLEYEEPPVYPDNMEVDSTENAVRFVEFVIDTVNYAQRFNDVEIVDSISTEGCTFCQGITDQFSMFRDNGSRRIGTELSCIVTSIEYQPDTGIFYLYSDCTQSEGATYGRDGDLLGTFDAEASQFTWAVTMINGVWKFVDAGSTVPEGGSS